MNGIKKIRPLKQHTTTHGILTTFHYPGGKQIEWSPNKIPNTIPYDSPISAYPEKRMDPKYVGKWLDMIMCHFDD